MNDDASTQEELKAPPRLVEALRQVAAQRIFVPPAIDQTILKAAERQLSHSRRRPAVRVWRWAAGLATASAMVVAIGLVTTQSRHSAPAFAVEDVNQDGQIDILDAFALARQVKHGGSAEKKLDLNGDGIVDDKDIATIAAHAVKLERGGRS